MCHLAGVHLEAAYWVFEYLYSHKTGSHVVFDDAKPKVNEEQFKEVNWKSIYGEVTEDIPSNIPESRGNTVIILMFTDAAFVGDLVTRRLQSGILMFPNCAPIIWYSKRQNIVEASTFGLKFIALRVGCETNNGLRYKVRMMGVPMEGPTNVYYDNEAIISNSNMTEPTLKKNHLSVCYHKTRECYAKGAVCISYKPTETNLADVCIKILIGNNKR